MYRTIGPLSLELLGIGIICLLAFRLVGSQVVRQGVQRQPFALLPLGFLLTGAEATSGAT